MRPIENICLLGLGEVGLVLAEDLLQNTHATIRIWDKSLRLVESAACRHRWSLSHNSRIDFADDPACAAVDCQLIISAVTADESLNAMDSILPGLAEKAWYVDLNSVSPVTKQRLSHRVEQAGGRFVEAAIMSPIAPQRSASPILLSGPAASLFETIGRDLGFANMRAVSDSLGTAAATKMCRSVIIKGMEALVSESLVAARYYGVEDAVLESLNNLFPRDDWPSHAHYLISRSLQHGSRRAAEMREVAKTVAEAGLDPWMSEASARRQDWAAQYPRLLCETHSGETQLVSLLDALQAQLDPIQTHKSEAL